jgi:hypothetical protein
MRTATPPTSASYQLSRLHAKTNDAKVTNQIGDIPYLANQIKAKNLGQKNGDCAFMFFARDLFAFWCFSRPSADWRANSKAKNLGQKNGHCSFYVLARDLLSLEGCGCFRFPHWHSTEGAITMFKMGHGVPRLLAVALLLAMLPLGTQEIAASWVSTPTQTNASAPSLAMRRRWRS